MEERDIAFVFMLDLTRDDRLFYLDQSDQSLSYVTYLLPMVDS